MLSVRRWRADGVKKGDLRGVVVVCRLARPPPSRGRTRAVRSDYRARPPAKTRPPEDESRAPRAPGIPRPRARAREKREKLAAGKTLGPRRRRRGRVVPSSLETPSGPDRNLRTVGARPGRPRSAGLRPRARAFKLGPESLDSPLPAFGTAAPDRGRPRRAARDAVAAPARQTPRRPSKSPVKPRRRDAIAPLAKTPTRRRERLLGFGRRGPTHGRARRLRRRIGSGI